MWPDCTSGRPRRRTGIDSRGKELGSFGFQVVVGDVELFQVADGLGEGSESGGVVVALFVLVETADSVTREIQLGQRPVGLKGKGRSN